MLESKEVMCAWGQRGKEWPGHVLQTGEKVTALKTVMVPTRAAAANPRQHAPRVPPISVEAQIEGHRFSTRQHPPPIPRSQALSGQLAVLNREGLWAQRPSDLDCPLLASVQVLCADQGSRCCFILAIWPLRLKGPLLCVS